MKFIFIYFWMIIKATYRRCVGTFNIFFSCSRPLGIVFVGGNVRESNPVGRESNPVSMPIDIKI